MEEYTIDPTTKSKLDQAESTHEFFSILRRWKRRRQERVDSDPATNVVSLGIFAEFGALP